MNKIVGLVFLMTFSLGSLYAQNGNFRSRVSGNWNVASTWERDADGNGIYEESPSVLTPTSLDGEILIQNGHTVRVYQNVTVDQVTVQSTGRIAVNSTNVLTVANGPGADLSNYGRVSTSAASQLVIGAGAEFVHAKNGGELPFTTWSAGSTCTIAGLTTAAPSNLTQSYSNFNWNSPGQLASINLDGKVTSVSGNFTIQNTNGQLLFLYSASVPGPLSIGGNLEVSGNSRVSLVTTGNLTATIQGDFNYFSSNGSGSVLLTAGGSLDMTVGGDWNIACSGALDLSGGAGTTEINLEGDFNLTAGSITETSSVDNFINFTGNTVQLFTNTSSILNSISYTIASGASVQTVGESPFTGKSIVVDGELRVTSTNTTGAILTSSTLGNVRTVTRTYNAGAIIAYAGNAPQFIGSGHPVTAGIHTRIDNAAGVTFNTTTSGNSGSTTLLITGDLILTQGNLNIESTSTTRNLTLNGAVTNSENSVSVSGANVNITINGSGAFGTFPNILGQAVRSLVINRTGGTVAFRDGLIVTTTTSVNSGTLELNGSNTLSGAVTLANGTAIDFSGASLTMGSNYTSSGGVLSADSGSTLTISGSVALTSPLNFSPSANTVGSFTLTKTNGGTSATISSTLNVSGSLTLNDGDLNIVGGALTMANGSNLTISSIASVQGGPPSGGPWNLTYIQGSKITGFEIPVNGVLESLTLNTSNGSTITLSQDIAINTFLTIASAGRSFNSSNRNVSIGTDLTNAGTFGAPFATASTGLTIGGDFVNTGTFTSNNGTVYLAGDFSNTGTFNAGIGTVNFNGSTSITGTSPGFYNVTISGTLNAPTNLIVNGAFVNNGVFNAGSGTVTFGGSAVQAISGSSTTTFNNITVTNASSPVAVKANSNVNLRGILNLSSASVFDADGDSGSAVFTLISDSNGDAGIAALTGTAAVTGNVTVQRFIPAKDDDYRYLSSPVTAAPVSQLQDDFAVTGTFTGTSYPCTGCTTNGPSLRSYTEANKGVFSNGYTAVPATNGTNAQALVPGRGYSSYMWNGISDITMDLTGTINSGTVNFTVSHTVSSPAEPTADGWNLIGNPYPSAIAWSNTGWTRTNIDATVWVWDVLAGNWRSYNADLATGDLTDGIIASGQGFWVYANPGAASLSVSESAKSNASGTYYRSVPSSSRSAWITLQGEKSSDNAFIVSTDDDRPWYGSPKLDLGVEPISLAMLTENGDRMAYFPVGVQRVDEIRLSYKVKKAGTYTFSFSHAGDVEQLSEFVLVDKKENTSISLEEEYSFVIDDSELWRDDRFSLLRKSGFGSENAGIIAMHPNPVNESLTVEIPRQHGECVIIIRDMKGVEVMRSTVSSDGALAGMSDSSKKEIMSMNNVPAGVYLVVVKSKSGNVAVRRIIKM
jgi:hypothetical protein